MNTEELEAAAEEQPGPGPSQAPEPDPPKNGRWRVAGKALGTLLITATATYGAARPETRADQAVEAGRVGYEELAQKVGELQRWAKASDDLVDAASGRCKAEVRAVQSYVAGYLLALGRSEARQSRRRTQDKPATAKAIEALLSRLGASDKPAASTKRALPKLSKPAPVQDIQRKAGF